MVMIMLISMQDKGQGRGDHVHVGREVRQKLQNFDHMVFEWTLNRFWCLLVS